MTQCVVYVAKDFTLTMPLIFLCHLPTALKKFKDFIVILTVLTGFYTKVFLDIGPNTRRMKEHYTYFIEKTSVLIRKLISGEGTAKERLLDCEVEIILALSTQIPEDLKPKRESILKRLNKKNEIRHGDIVSMTSFRHTLIYMKNKTAAKIILDIYDLYSEILFRDRFN